MKKTLMDKRWISYDEEQKGHTFSYFKKKDVEKSIQELKEKLIMKNRNLKILIEVFGEELVK